MRPDSSTISMASSCTSKRNVDIIYRDMMEQVMESGRPRAPLHLKVLAAYCLSAHQLQEGQSVFESVPLRSKQACVITPSSQPACLVAVRREGEKCTKLFRKRRKITSLGTSSRRNPSVPRAGADRNGLWDVKEARTSPLLPPESRRLEALFSDFLRKVLVL